MGFFDTILRFVVLEGCGLVTLAVFVLLPLLVGLGLARRYTRIADEKAWKQVQILATAPLNNQPDWSRHLLLWTITHGAPEAIWVGGPLVEGCHPVYFRSSGSNDYCILYDGRGVAQSLWLKDDDSGIYLEIQNLSRADYALLDRFSKKIHRRLFEARHALS